MGDRHVEGENKAGLYFCAYWQQGQQEEARTGACSCQPVSDRVECTHTWRNAARLRNLGEGGRAHGGASRWQIVERAITICSWLHKGIGGRRPGSTGTALAEHGEAG